MVDTPDWMDETDGLAARGMAMRALVLGEEHVAKSLSGAADSPVRRALQDSVTRLAWGGVWSREGLDPRHRSLATVSVLLAQGRLDELALHLRGARRLGWSEEELIEVVLQVACYAGWPAAVQGLRVLEHVLAAEAGTR